MLNIIKVRFWPIVLKKSVFPGCRVPTAENAFLARCYVKSEPEALCSKIRISISGAYFSAVETVADFFNRFGRKPPVMIGSY
ncbi:MULTISPECIES: hypothetical protein [unclassified Pseudomonas]|uniref:hypothetical protein n=1 Tax=unclassified Pseudomonas TaxID=196821 RepID=UPI00087195EA|nr:MULTISPECIES: hypothetical protein [unclassified Pseudomonas]SCW78305.1 hypothetical protein SAMN03159481_02492 [Pseudomonas sp. NFACC56-3]SFK39438.1 hypothetical protein SAMN03159473_01813 [Pseudomonas sp. NFACC52]